MTSDGSPEARARIALRGRDTNMLGHLSRAVHHGLLAAPGGTPA